MSATKPSPDRLHRLLFQHRQLIEDLIRHFVGESWIRELDFTTLERLHEGSVTEDLHHRVRDIAWSVRWRESTLYVIVLIEFQSRPDWFMALRELAYLATFYQDLVKARRLRSGDHLPPVLPVVLYSGETPWNAPRSMEELLEPDLPPELRLHQPRFRYLLLDELHTRVGLGEERNTLAALMAIEQSETPEQLQRVVATLIDWLPAEEDAPLRRSFATILNRLIPFGDADQAADHPPDLLELDMGLRKNLERWRDDYAAEARADARREGQAEGESRGRAEALRKMLGRQLLLKFGPPSAEQSATLADATVPQLEAWAEEVLTAATLADLFARKI